MSASPGSLSAVPGSSVPNAPSIRETLRDALAEALDKVRVGRLAPETIAVRVLISDMTVPMALPSRAETQADDPAVRERGADHPSGGGRHHRSGHRAGRPRPNPVGHG